MGAYHEPNTRSRPLISMSAVEKNVLLLDGQKARVVMTPTMVMIGCTDITAEAAAWVFCEHARRFQSQTVQLPEGEEPKR